MNARQRIYIHSLSINRSKCSWKSYFMITVGIINTLRQNVPACILLLSELMQLWAIDAINLRHSIWWVHNSITERIFFLFLLVHDVEMLSTTLFSILWGCPFRNAKLEILSPIPPFHSIWLDMIEVVVVSRIIQIGPLFDYNSCSFNRIESISCWTTNYRLNFVRFGFVFPKSKCSYEFFGN